MLEKKPSKPGKEVAKKRELFSRKPFLVTPATKNLATIRQSLLIYTDHAKKKNGKVGDRFK